MPKYRLEIRFDANDDVQARGRAKYMTDTLENNLSGLHDGGLGLEFGDLDRLKQVVHYTWEATVGTPLVELR